MSLESSWSKQWQQNTKEFAWGIAPSTFLFGSSQSGHT